MQSCHCDFYTLIFLQCPDICNPFRTFSLNIQCGNAVCCEVPRSPLSVGTLWWGVRPRRPSNNFLFGGGQRWQRSSLELEPEAPPSLNSRKKGKALPPPRWAVKLPVVTQPGATPHLTKVTIVLRWNSFFFSLFPRKKKGRCCCCCRHRRPLVVHLGMWWGMDRRGGLGCREASSCREEEEGSFRCHSRKCGDKSGWTNQSESKVTVPNERDDGWRSSGVA